MPEAVIVATARSPIGRAFKGSLRELRPDDLAALMVKAAVDKIPQLDPRDVADLILGCGQPGGEQGNNLARVVAVQLGYDHLPGVTLTRYCASSVQTTRMAFHAIKAGEGDVFISAGVETVSRSVKGNSDTLPDTQNPVFAAARARTVDRAAGGASVWQDPRAAGRPPDAYIDMGQTAENVAQLRGITRREQDEFAVRSQNLAEQAVKDGFFAREITAVALPDGTSVDTDDGPRPGVTLDGISGLKPVFRPDGTVTAGNACPLNDGAAALVVMSDTVLGRDPRRHHRRRRHARPASAPLGRAQPRRRLLPAPRPLRPHRHPPARHHRTHSPTPILTTATEWGTSVSNSGQDH
jgi:acetyl-CoA C-acetyltransferase